MNRYPGISDEHAAAIVAREPFEAVQTRAYLTEGGTYIIGSGAMMNDDDQPHDLLAVTPWDTVYPLRPTANPEPVERILADAAREAVTR